MPVNLGGPTPAPGGGANPADDASRLSAAFGILAQTVDLLNRQHVQQWRLQSLLQQQIVSQVVPAVQAMVKAFVDATTALRNPPPPPTPPAAGAVASPVVGGPRPLTTPQATPPPQAMAGFSFPNVAVGFQLLQTSMRQLQVSTLTLATSMTTAVSQMSNPIAELVRTFDPGAVYRFELAFRNLQAHMGGAMLPVLERLTGVVKEMAAWLGGLNPEAQRLITGLAGMAAAMTAVGIAMHLIALASGGLVQIAGMAAGALVGLGVSFGDLGGLGSAVKDVMHTLGQVFNTLAVAAEPMLASVGDMVGRIVAIMAGLFEEAAPVIAGVMEMLAGHVDRLAPTFERLFKILADVFGSKELLIFQVLAMTVDAALTNLEAMIAMMDPMIAVLEAAAAAFARIVAEVRKLPFLGDYVKQMEEHKNRDGYIAAMPARSGSIEGIGQANRIAAFSMGRVSQTPEEKATREEAQKTREALDKIRQEVAGGRAILGKVI